MRVNGFLQAYLDFMFVEWQFEVKEILKDMGSTFRLRFAPIGEELKEVHMSRIICCLVSAGYCCGLAHW